MLSSSWLNQNIDLFPFHFSCNNNNNQIWIPIEMYLTPCELRTECDTTFIWFYYGIHVHSKNRKSFTAMVCGVKANFHSCFKFRMHFLENRNYLICCSQCNATSDVPKKGKAMQCVNGLHEACRSSNLHNFNG